MHKHHIISVCTELL